jgi:uncharacterized DUF497 family protein
MEISFDPHKRLKTLEERNLDFADAGQIFQQSHFTILDDRVDYGEDRYITVGNLKHRMVIIVWTPRNGGRRIISMRQANDREKARYEAALDRPG